MSPPPMAATLLLGCESIPKTTVGHMTAANNTATVVVVIDDACILSMLSHTGVHQGRTVIKVAICAVVKH